MKSIFIKDNKTVRLYRNESNTALNLSIFKEQFLNGYPPHLSGAGNSRFGSGVYASNKKRGALDYSDPNSDNYLYKMTINKNAKIMELSEQQVRKFIAKYSNENTSSMVNK